MSDSRALKEKESTFDIDGVVNQCVERDQMTRSTDSDKKCGHQLKSHFGTITSYHTLKHLFIAEHLLEVVSYFFKGCKYQLVVP